MLQCFSNEVDLWGDNSGKMVKKWMKVTKSAFLGQNSEGGMGEQAGFLSSGGISPVLVLYGQT